MNTKAPLTREQALAFIREHELHYMDVFAIVAAYAETVEGSIKGESPRVLIHIKQRPRVKKAKPAKKVAK